jgi:hypothetical protein
MEASNMGDRIIAPSHEETGYYSRLRKPLSNPRQRKCPFKIKGCKVCYPKLASSKVRHVGDGIKDKHVLKAPDWVRDEISVYMVLANFYPNAATDPKEQKKAIRDFELIDVAWRRREPGHNSPWTTMTRAAVRKRLSRIRKDAEKHIMRKDEDPSWFVVSLPPADWEGPYTDEEYDDMIDGLVVTGNLDPYIRKWCLPHYFHIPHSK